MVASLDLRRQTNETVERNSDFLNIRDALLVQDTTSLLVLLASPGQLGTAHSRAG